MAFPVAQTVTSLSGTYIPEVWSGKLLLKFYEGTCLAKIANTDYEGEIRQHGDKVHIRDVPTLTIRDYTKGQNLQYEQPVPSDTTLLIDKGKYFAFPVNPVDMKQSDVAYVEKWATDASEQMKIQIETAVWAAIYSSAATYNKGDTAGYKSRSFNLGKAGASIALTKSNILDYILYCGACLDEYSVPETDRWMILPVWAVMMLKLSDIKDQSMMNDGKPSVLRNGRIGMVDRFTVYSSNLLNVVTDTYSVTNAMFGHKSALTFATQLTANEVVDNPNDFGKLHRGLQVYGYKVVKPEALGHLYIRPSHIIA